MRRAWICAASAAALATTVGTGWAAAQERQPGQDQTPSTPKMENGRRGETAQPVGRVGEQPAQMNRQTDKATQAEPGKAVDKTDQGSASAPRRTGGNVQAMGATHISNQSASRIADALLATAAPQNFNVDVSVDGLLPGELDLRPLPPAVAELIPEYRGYEYVVANDEVFIVQPSTRRVVEIIREGGPTQAKEGLQRINLTDAQQRMLIESVRSAGLPEARESAELADGATVPADVTLEPVPRAVVVEIPMIERYRLFVANDRVVLVDPDTREVVDVVR
ncbi:MAG: DUF1236 domain-containing protein [Roseiarcus sp.]|uniref:DUF1236 domain-containing protein n=1 Tax=Roseiarcus sp. TaxID=1969460 RepID=UPI003C602045